MTQKEPELKKTSIFTAREKRWGCTIYLVIWGVLTFLLKTFSPIPTFFESGFIVFAVMMLLSYGAIVHSMLWLKYGNHPS